MSFLARLLGRRLPPVPVTMYVREDCKLCDEMKRELQRAGLAGQYELRVVDIDTQASEAVRSDHNQWVPVLEIGDRVAFKVRMQASEFRKRFKKLAAEYHAKQARSESGA